MTPRARPAPPFPPDAVAAWEAAETALYHVVAARPDLYQQSVVLVAGVAAALRTFCLEPADLLDWAGPEAAAQRLATVTSVAEAAGISMGSTRSEDVARAACAIRSREIAAERAAGERVARLAAAPPREWTTLEEWGDPHGTAWAPYHRLEVLAGTGAGVLVVTEPDVDLAGVVHRVSPVRVDLGSGSVVPFSTGTEGEPGDTARDDGEREALATTWKTWLRGR
jgi:hypothetical protein